jgi:hypothetical protein
MVMSQQFSEKNINIGFFIFRKKSKYVNNLATQSAFELRNY